MPSLETSEVAVPPSAVPDRYPGMVLLVDDQRMVAEAVRRALADQPNIDFHYCASAAEALAVARQVKPTLILQDLVMPDGDGLDLVRQYRADPVTKEIPIVVLSTKEEPAVKGAAFSAGANDYLVKLPDKIELIARVQYHSASYLNQVQRNDAYRLLRESERRLSERNFEIQVVNEGLAREVKFRKQKNLEQAALANFSISALSEDNFEAVMQLAVATARETLKADMGAAGDIDPVADTVRFIGERDRSTGLVAPLRLSQYSQDSILTVVATTKKPAFIANTVREKRLAPVGNSAALGLKCTAMVPLVFTEGAPGFLMVSWLEPRDISQDDMDFLQSLSNMLVVFQARAKTLERLRLRDRALEAITQGVTIRDDRIQGRPIIYTNPAFAALTGYRMDEILGRATLSFFPPDVATILADRMSRVDKAMLHGDVKMVRADGSSFLDQMQASPILEPDGAAHYYVTVHENVTEARKRDELVLDAQRLESVRQLSGGIAHDFNNLLVAIRSNAEDLRADLKENKLLAGQANIILQAADRGADLVAQMMAYARKQELEPRPTQVDALLDSMRDDLKKLMTDGIKIEIKTEPGVPRVNVDPERIKTALMNVASNARDAMPKGGSFTIEAAVQSLDADYAGENLDVQPGRYVCLALTDSGIGMAKEVLQRAFVPFFTTKEVGSGTGLGLSMVHGFVKQSGGHTKIYSEPGHGTVVKIYLPATYGDEAVEESGFEGNGRNMLIVEDDDLLRQSVCSRMVRAGYAVTAASTAEGALSMLAGMTRCDLVFTDIMLPGRMSGADLARVLGRDRPEIKVLMTSGYTAETAPRKVELPEGIRVLSKPYATVDLLKALAETLAE